MCGERSKTGEMPRLLKKLSLITLIGVALMGGVYGLFRFKYPYGTRTCFLPCLNSALQLYAHDHNGAFPDDLNPYVALQKLYPEYMPNAEGLAGISGDRKAIARTLRTG